MSVILVLIPLSIVCAAGFLAAFIWAVRSGQYEDTCTPSMRLLLDDPMKKTSVPRFGPPLTRPELNHSPAGSLPPTLEDGRSNNRPSPLSPN